MSASCWPIKLRVIPLFCTFRAVTAPIPQMYDTVSHHVSAWAAGSCLMSLCYAAVAPMSMTTCDGAFHCCYARHRPTLLVVEYISRTKTSVSSQTTLNRDRNINCVPNPNPQSYYFSYDTLNKSHSAMRPPGGLAS